ncbi:MAG TPA: hypothetical protein VJ578_05525 [Dehalococcoidia bacterium]|nr:hypothetical protein [Dehalococcoidia bacterium]
MDWAWGIPLVLFVLACPLMMVGMMAFGWLFMRGRSGSHGDHGMMMCHGGHGGNGHESHEQGKPAESADLVAELKAQRERMDQLIARAEEKAAR